MLIAIRFALAVAVLLTISVSEVHLLPPPRGDFKLLACTVML